MYAEALHAAAAHAGALHACLLALLLMAPAGCGSLVADDDGPLPTGRSCDPGGEEAIDATIGIPYASQDMPCLGLTMDPASFRALSRSNRFGAAEPARHLLKHLTTDCTTPFAADYPWFEADLQAGDERLTRIGVRKKGFLGSVTGHGMLKPSLKLKIDKFVPNRTLGDDERVTLNNSVQDPTRVRTCLAYDLFARAGYPASRCNLVALMVNDAAMGAYVHLEPIKKRFLRRNFGSDEGSLYEGTLVDLVPEFFGGEAMPGGLGRWEAKTSDSDPGGKPLLALQRALEAPDDRLVESLEPVLDLDRFVTFWALEILIGHADGYASNRNNFFIYFDPEDGNRATFLPWGIDDVFRDDGDDSVPQSYTFSELPRRLSHNPEYSRRLQQELTRLLDTVWDEEEILARMDGYVEQVQRAETGPDYASKLEELRSWIMQRRSRLTEHLSDGLPRGSATRPSCFQIGLRSGLGAIQDVADGVATFTFAW